MNSEIERLAEEAELADEFGRPLPAYPRRLAKFAALVAEECAKHCETLRFSELGPTKAAQHQRNLCAYAIRAKFALRHETPEAK